MCKQRRTDPNVGEPVPTACKTPIVSSILTPASNFIPYNFNELCGLLFLENFCGEAV
jgi:hypothetical protein